MSIEAGRALVVTSGTHDCDVSKQQHRTGHTFLGAQGHKLLVAALSTPVT